MKTKYWNWSNSITMDKIYLNDIKTVTFFLTRKYNKQIMDGNGGDNGGGKGKDQKDQAISMNNVSKRFFKVNSKLHENTIYVTFSDI